ncbi:MAG: ribonuclease HII [Bacteroidales bacterium]
MALKNNFSGNYPEAGCDEAGRGCLAGPVFASAVILPEDFSHPLLMDSKKMSRTQREKARIIIEENALAWAVESIDNQIIDEKNILWASILAMHKALDKLNLLPEYIIVDGNKFKPYKNIPHHCIVKGDSLFLSIAAASILSKTYRDDFMQQAHYQYPVYGWNSNKGYPTASHAKAIYENGLSPLHRRTFSTPAQYKLQFDR